MWQRSSGFKSIRTPASVMPAGSLRHAAFALLLPAVMVDRHNRMLLVFNRTGENEFPAIRFTGRRASDRANTLQASALLKQSPVPGGKVWSACSGASLDPSGSDFWIIGQYTFEHNEWATWIGETTYAPRATDLNAPSVRSRSRRKQACA
jgi:hypothetical protein